MTKEQYSILLTRVEWQRKRLKILERDKHTCRKCKCKANLHVHHIWYIDGKRPWEVPDGYLITLCEKCHKKAHDGRSISSFIKYIKERPPSFKQRYKGNRRNIKY